MFAVLIGSKLWPGRYMWPGTIRNAGMITVGYTIGLAMTATALHEMSIHLPIMLLLTLLLLFFCAGIAFLVSLVSNYNYMTLLIGSIPGGLSQMVALAEESDDIDMTVVTVIQVVRLMVIVVSIPFLIFNPYTGLSDPVVTEMAGALGNAGAAAAATWSNLLPDLPVYAVVCTLCAWLGQKLRIPTAYLLGPAIGASVLQMLGVHGPALPSTLVNAAQLAIGSYVGMLLKPEQLPHKMRTIGLAVGSAIILIAGAWGFSSLLTLIQPVSMTTALLALAPGGMDQMGIIAHEVGGDLSIVAGYQLFRLLFIFFAVPPVMKMLLRLRRSRRGKSVS